ncbi:MAG: hypothetical protein JWO94_2064 [Verrucomicrobiaceae bacterium]|nr:hypothetical protein [Verrucomicrobiaceae bacterium]
MRVGGTSINDRNAARLQMTSYRFTTSPMKRQTTFYFLLLPLLAVTTPVVRAQQVIKAEQASWKAPVPPELMTEQELIQQTISMHLMVTDQEQSRRLRQNMDIVIGDVRRVAGLPKERQRLLEIAAKGAVDRHMESWRSAEENQTRQQALGITAAQVRQRLEGLGTVTVGSAGPPEENPLWRDTLTNILTAEERQKWAEAESGRDDYRQQAIIKLLVAEMDRQLDLTLTQCEKVEPLAARVMRDYLPDMAMYMDRGNGIDFRLLLTAFSAVPDAERQTVLTQPQVNKWLQVTSDFRSLWQNIEQNHQQRMQASGGTVAKPPGPFPIIIRGNAARMPIIINGGGGIILRK